MKFILSSLFFLALFTACDTLGSPAERTSALQVESFDTTFIHMNWSRVRYCFLPGCKSDSVDNIAHAFPVPEGCERIELEQNSFSEWCRFLPVWPGKRDVKLYNGSLKKRQDVHAGIIRIDAGKGDLQQCADAVMRLRAEYLFSKGRYEEIVFNYTSGDRLNYTDWCNGSRISVSGNKTQRIKVGHRKDSSSHDVLQEYLRSVFMYAGTLSLSKEMVNVPVDSIMPGDVFIWGGSPGHAVLVTDVAVNKKGQRYFLLSQSYMPAQEIHVLKNFEEPGLSPWYSTSFGDMLRTPEWDFAGRDLKRFQ